MKKTYDVIVVGGGGSGLAAAVSSAENGLEVLLLEKMPVLGGTTGIAVGAFTGNRTSLQEKSGILDNLDNHVADVAKFASPEIEAKNNVKLREYFLSHTAETYNWLERMGLRFHGPNPEPPNRVPRMHNVVPNAKAYVAALQRRLLGLGGDIQCGAAVKKLIAAEGAVRGLEVELEGGSVDVQAQKGIVMAAGDYSNSKELIARFKGDEYAEIDGINPHSKDDGHRIIERIGGSLLNMEVTWGPEIRFVPPPKEPFVHLMPSTGIGARLGAFLFPFVPRGIMNMLIKRLLVTWQHPEASLFEDGAILVNDRGERFCNERASPEREIAIARQTKNEAFIILDKRLINRYSKWPHFISTAPEIAYAYVADYLRLRPDVSAAAESLADLAYSRNIPIESLARTVEDFNSYACGEQKDPHGRTGDTEGLEGSRWVLLGPARAYFTITEGGAQINQDFQVMDRAGKLIKGLYAVGCNGLGGQILFGHGLHIAWALTSGRLVGEVLSRREREREPRQAGTSLRSAAGRKP